MRREWLVSVDSLHALRATRSTGEGVPESDRTIEYADSIADVVREMSARSETRAEEAAELRVRLELTEQAQSTLEDERHQALQELEEERRRREEAERERAELRRRLEAPHEARESPEGPGPSESPTPAPGDAEEAAQSAHSATLRPQGNEVRGRSWWRRVFGG